ncbi:MAG: hypothetical protein AB1758_16815 [Candidatus Eremiobacterota bacterium]
MQRALPGRCDFNDTLYRLAFSGHLPEAHRFLEQAWPGGRPGVEEHWQGFPHEAEEDDTWPLVREVNRL